MARPRRRRRRHAFTLIEMIAVLVVLGVLFSLGLVAYGHVRTGIDDGKARDLLRTVSAAQQANYTNRGDFLTASTGEADLQALAPNTAGYTAADTAPDRPLQVSVAAGVGFGSVPVVGLATVSASGTCLLHATYAPDSGRADLEDTADPDQVAGCTGQAALAALHTGQAPAGADLPAAAADLTVTTGPGTLTLAWSPVAGADDYRIYRQAPGTDFTLLAETSTPGYPDTGLPATTDDGPAVYAYYVVAHNASGWGQPSAQVTGTPDGPDPGPVGAPWQLRATSSAAGVALTWQGPAAAAGYRVSRDDTRLADVDPATTGGDAAGYLDATAEPGATYRYQVTALPAALGDGSTTTRTVTTPPAAPATLTAAPVDAGAGCPADPCITLTWPAAPADPATGQPAPTTGYQVYRCRTDACDGDQATGYRQLPLVGTTTATGRTLTDTGLAGATSYTYVVVATNRAGTSWTGTTATTTTVPGPVEGLTARATGPAQNTLTWAAATPDPTGYQISRLGPDGTWQILAAADPTATGWTEELDTPTRARYTYRIAALSPAGVGLPSAPASTSSWPTTPELTVARVTRTGAVELAWDTQDGAVYTVTRNGDVLATDLADGSYRDQAVAPASTYTYRISATRGDAGPATGAPATVTTAPDPVTGLAAATVITADAAATTTLTWHPVAGATRYAVYQCDPAPAGTRCEDPQVLATVTGLDWTRAATLAVGGDLEPDTRYSYAVAAVTDTEATSATGPLSAVATTDTWPVTPTAVAADSEVGAVTVSWDTDPLATYYLIATDPADPEGTELVRVAADGQPRQHVTVATTPAATGDPARWGVFAGNDAGLNPAGAPVPATTAPATQPVAVAATSTGRTVTLTWSAPGATRYQLLRCTGVCDPTGTGAPVVSGTDRAATGGVTDTVTQTPSVYTYAVTVSSTPLADPAVWTDVSAPLTIATRLPAPTGLTVTDTRNTSLTVAWNPVGDAVGYDVYLDQTPLAVLDATQTGYTVTGLTPGQRYTLAVRARSSTGLSSATTTEAVTALAAPAASVAYIDTGAGVTLTWPTVPGAVRYEVYYCLGVGCVPTTLAGTTTATSFTHPGADTMPSPRYRVRSVGAAATLSNAPAPGGYSDYSTTVIANTAGSYPPNLHASAWTETADHTGAYPSLLWNAGTGVSGYRVAGYDPAGNRVVVLATTGASTNGGVSTVAVPLGTSTTVRVAVVRADGSIGKYSPAVTITAPPAAPTTAPTPTLVSGNEWALTWDPVPAATSYQLYREVIDPANPTSPLSSTMVWSGAALTVHDTTAGDPTRQYAWRYAACNAGGCSLTQSPRSTSVPAN